MSNRAYKIGELAKMTGIHVKTLQRWDREGVLPAHRTKTNRRYYTHDQYLEALGRAPRQENRRTVLYTRVSSRGQRTALDTQTQFLREFANARGWVVDEVVSDIGSGLNYKRVGFNKVMYANDLERVIVSHKDRLSRFGADWFISLLESKGVEVVVVNNDTTSPEEELVQDLISIVHVFSSRVYGLRRYKKQIADDQGLDRRNINEAEHRNTL